MKVIGWAVAPFLNVHSSEPNSLGPAASTCQPAGLQCPVTNTEEAVQTMEDGHAERSQLLAVGL